jgi:hypothetical protein
MVCPVDLPQVVVSEIRVSFRDMRGLRSFTAVMGLIAGCIILASAQTPATKAPSSTAKPRSSATKPARPVMREAFTLHLKVDKDHYEDFHYDKQPYVSENEVYLFSGDKFGVNLIMKGNRVVEVRYQPEESKADLVFGFEQPKELQGGVAMALTIDNKIKNDVGMEAMGGVPGKKDPFKDKITPVKAGKSSTEFWPQPIAQLVLGNFQLTSEGPTPPKTNPTKPAPLKK